MTDDIASIELALISHTNNGKTALARTLLGLDVGEVRDAAHVTTFTNAYPLLATPQGDTLQLWDTPGFGDSVRLLKRIDQSDNPVGWFLREVLDRYRDRAFWLSQKALRTARESADVVLYLVNASEHPDDAAYLPSELKILGWLDKPVLVLLNQMGEPQPAGQEAAEQARWRQYFERFPIVRGVLLMDAWARCWVHEHVFYEAIGQLLPRQQHQAYQRIRALWQANNAQRYQQAMSAVGRFLADAARESESIDNAASSLGQAMASAVGIGRDRTQQRREQAKQAFAERLAMRANELTSELIRLHRLAAGERNKIDALVSKFFVVNEPLDQAKAGLYGAIAAGATTGISADLLSGGLTLGGGALLGGLVGALTFAGAAWSSNALNERHEPIVQFSTEGLNQQLVSCVLRYLAVAHFGRGRGQFADSEAPPFWRDSVDSAVQANANELAALWVQLRASQDADLALDRLIAVVTSVTTHTLATLYPGVTLGSGDASRTGSAEPIA